MQGVMKFSFKYSYFSKRNLSQVSFLIEALSNFKYKNLSYKRKRPVINQQLSAFISIVTVLISFLELGNLLYANKEFMKIFPR